MPALAGRTGGDWEDGEAAESLRSGGSVPGSAACQALAVEAPLVRRRWQQRSGVGVRQELQELLEVDSGPVPAVADEVEIVDDRVDDLQAPPALSKNGSVRR